MHLQSPSNPELPPLAQQQADLAKIRAEESLRHTQNVGSEVDRLTQSLRQMRRRNQFAEMMYESFRGNT